MRRRRPRIEQLWHRDLAPAKWPIWAALTPLSGLYRVALKVRSRWPSPLDHASLPVISVGNLTVGGNAKTPFTIYLANLLQARGYRVGIVSRGYGREHKAARLVAEAGRLVSSVTDIGDEPAMMAYRFDGPIAVAGRRIEAIRLLKDRSPLDVVVLDDGFQHSLHRDLDLVVIAARNGFGNGWVLPAGPLREPLASLRRADLAILITTDDDDAGILTTSERRALAHRPLLHALLRPAALVQASTVGWLIHPLALKGCNVVAVSGLANPANFTTMLTKLGARIVSSFAFPDHHRYDLQDWSEIRAAAEAADRVITTEKDLVKLQAFSPPVPSLYALRLELRMDEEAEAQLLGMASDAIQLTSTSRQLESR